jgi:hypothetical protein
MVRFDWAPLAEFKIVRFDNGLNHYGQVALAERKFWVHRRHWAVVEGWERR